MVEGNGNAWRATLGKEEGHLSGFYTENAQLC